MNRFDIHRPHRRSVAVAGLATAGLLAAAAVSGCSSGQLAQTSQIVAAVNGNAATVNNVALRNVHLQAVQTGDFLRPGQTVELVLAVTNQSPDVADRLVGVTTDIGTVTISGSGRLPAGGVLFIGTPADSNIEQVANIQTANVAGATVSLAKPITNGLNYDFTFDFEKAGSITLAVPVSAGTTQPGQ